MDATELLIAGTRPDPCWSVTLVLFENYNLETLQCTMNVRRALQRLNEEYMKGIDLGQ